jgi:hypothetical protein
MAKIFFVTLIFLLYLYICNKNIEHSDNFSLRKWTSIRVTSKTTNPVTRGNTCTYVISQIFFYYRNRFNSLYVLLYRNLKLLGFDSRQGLRIFLLTTASRTAWGPHRGTKGSFPGGKATETWSWPLNSIQCRGQRMCGAIPSLHTTPSWRGGQLKNTGTTLPLPF